MRKIFLIAILFISIPCVASASNYYYGNKGNGWFWYAVQPVPGKKQKPEKINWQAVKTMPAEQFSKFYKKLKNEAISTASPKLVYDLMKAQKIMLDRSQKFTDAWSYELALHPSLRYSAMALGGNSTFKSSIATEIKANKQIETLKKIRSRIGLALFYIHKNGYGRQEDLQLTIICNEYGFEHTIVMIRRHPNMAAKFGIITSPSIVMLYRHKNGSVSHYIISQGLRTRSQIEKDIYYYYTYIIKGKRPYGGE